MTEPTIVRITDDPDSPVHVGDVFVATNPDGSEGSFFVTGTERVGDETRIKGVGHGAPFERKPPTPPMEMP